MSETRVTRGRQHFYGKFRGKVLENVDPLFQGRIIASVPAISGSKLNWAMPCTPYAGPDVGFYAIPPIGANVWVEFEGGDPNYPIWSGCFWGPDQLPKVPEPPPPEVKVFKTEYITMILNDIAEEGGFTLKCVTPAVDVPLTMLFNSEGITILCPESSIKMTPESITATVPESEINMTAETITLTVPESVMSMTAEVVSIDVPATTVTLSGEAVEIESPTVNITAETNIEPVLNVDGATELAGALAVEGAAEFAGAMAVEGAVDFAGALVVEGAVDIAGGLVIEGGGIIDGAPII